MRLKSVALALGGIVVTVLVFVFLLAGAMKHAPEIEVTWTEDLGELIEIQIVNYQSFAIRVTFIYENGMIEKTVIGLVFRIILSDVGGAIKEAS